MLNVLNWTRTGSFMQRLSAADLGYWLWKGGANKEEVAVLRIRIRDPEEVFSGSRISDPGSQTYIFDSLMTNWARSTITLSVFLTKKLFTFL